MKKFQKCLTACLLTVMVLSLFVLGAFAETATQDGLTVELTTDKATYGAGESITAILTVTNTNNVPMQSVVLKQLVPAGYQMSEGQTDTKSVMDLQPGQSVSLSVMWTGVDQPDEGFDLMKFYENNKTLVHIVGIALGGILLVVLVALGIHKLRYSFIALVLCSTMLFGAVSGTVVQVQALEPVEGSVKVSATVTADGKEVKLEGTADYSMEPEVTTEAVCTVTFDTMGGSAVEPQQVDNGGLAVRPDVPTREGHVFVGWYADAELENLFDFAAPITSSCTVYAYWINTEDETDTDGDGLTDELERYFGTDKEKVDTDGDGLNDYVEIMMLNYDPLKTDTDGNGTADDREDLDQDGLVNVHEVQRGTDPTIADTDSDALSDADEIHTYTTDPLLSDTDGDGVSDGKEIELGTDPLAEQAVFEMEVFADTEDSVTPSVKIDLPGEQVESLSIEAVHNETFFPETMPGYMGQAYDFNVDGEFESAEISFAFDESLLAEGADPVIYYFNEDTQELEALETVIEGNVAKATVQHFSKYILIDRSIYEDQFMWTDVWDSEHNYTDIEIVFVIDDSGSMDWNDPYFERLSVARTLIDNLPVNSKIGLVRFDGGYPKTEALTKTLTADKEVVKNFLTREYFYSPGGTDMYNGINKAFPLFESAEPTTLKMMIVLSDGATVDTYLHSSVIETANNSNVRIYTVGLGSSTSYFNNYMKPLATNTGAVFYLASDATQLAEIYRDIKEKIDIETDSDDDGIPDYYEDNMIYFNGVKLVLDKNNPDSDGDGLKDGEEVELKYEYNEDRTQVKVTGKIIGGNPVNKDTDGDGWIDSDDEHPMVWDVSDRDLAMLSQIVYQNIPVSARLDLLAQSNDANVKKMAAEIEDRFLDGADLSELAGWRVVNTLYGLGIQCAAYKKDNNIVIAYRGSENVSIEEFWHDWIVTDAVQLFAGLNIQAPFAKYFVREVLNTYNNYNVYITGHSLGGNLAYYAADEALDLSKGVNRVCVFNALGLSNSFFKNIDEKSTLKVHQEIIRCYKVLGDVVSNLPNTVHYGTVIESLKCPDMSDLFGPHHLHSFLDMKLPRSKPNGLTDIEAIIHSKLSSVKAPDTINNGDAVGFLQIDKKEDWPEKLHEVSSGVSVDGREWTRYYYERLYYGEKIGSYLIYLRNPYYENVREELYLMYAKAGKTVLGGNGDEIYRKVNLKGNLSNNYLQTESGNAWDMYSNAIDSKGGYCKVESEADQLAFLYWDASQDQILTSVQWQYDIHYGERFALNNEETLPKNACDAVKEGFVKLPLSETKYHQIDIPIEDLKDDEYQIGACVKYCHKDGREAIYLIGFVGQTKESIESNQGVTVLLPLYEYPDAGPTYNYSPNDSPETGKGFLEDWVSEGTSKISHNSIAHYYFDMLPYYWWENVEKES